MISCFSSISKHRNSNIPFKKLFCSVSILLYASFCVNPPGTVGIASWMTDVLSRAVKIWRMLSYLNLLPQPISPWAALLRCEATEHFWRKKMEITTASQKFHSDHNVGCRHPLLPSISTLGKARTHCKIQDSTCKILSLWQWTCLGTFNDSEPSCSTPGNTRTSGQHRGELTDGMTGAIISFLSSVYRAPFIFLATHHGASLQFSALLFGGT